VLRTQHKSISEPVGAPKNNQFGAIFIEFGDTKKCYTFSGLELVTKSRKKLIGALSCMHKGPKCIQTLWDHQKKFLFLETTKNARYMRSLGLIKVLRVLRCAKNRSPEAKKNGNPSGLSEKNVS